MNYIINYIMYERICNDIILYKYIILSSYIKSLTKGPSAKVFPGQLNGGNASFMQPTRPKMVESALNQIPQTWLINLTSNWICPKWGSPKFRSLPCQWSFSALKYIEMMRLFGMQY